MVSFSNTGLVDVAIVGGGPAGLAAAIYLSRFLRSVVICDADDGRAKLIPRTRNCPGFPEGIQGEDLLSRLRTQVATHGTQLAKATVAKIQMTGRRFSLQTR